MQTKQIKIGDTYAYKRGDSHVRFQVTGIHTTRNATETVNKIAGHFLEDGDRKEWKLDPDSLLGPIAQYEELVKRKQDEEAKRKADEEQRRQQALSDRRMLYKFIGAEAPKDPKDYHQMFRVSFSSCDVQSEGLRALIKRIREGFPSLTGETK